MSDLKLLFALLAFFGQALFFFWLGHQAHKSELERVTRSKDATIETLKKLSEGLRSELEVNKQVAQAQKAVMEDLREDRRNLERELAKVNDPETARVVKMRKQMQDDQAAFNLLCNYGIELAYGQVSAGDLLGTTEGRA